MIKDKIIAFRITEREKEELLQIAKLQDKRLSYVLQSMVKDYLEQNKK